jgi:hypothetical protein
MPWFFILHPSAAAVVAHLRVIIDSSRFTENRLIGNATGLTDGFMLRAANAASFVFVPMNSSTASVNRGGHLSVVNSFFSKNGLPDRMQSTLEFSATLALRYLEQRCAL